MRIAAIADIHGNIRALEAVRADVVKRSPDVVVNLGDNVSGPLQAAATADLLMHESYIHVRGNHDRQVIDRSPAVMGLSDRAAHGQLNSRHLAWLSGLPATQMLGEDILLCHGSPADDLEYLLEQIENDHVRLASPQQIQERLGNVRASLILCGHTHIPRIVSLPGGVWAVNPGSVGLPAYDDTRPALHYVETGSPHARYAIINWEPPKIRVEVVAVDYDWQSASKEAAQANRPDWAHALATGYALKTSQ
jgi:putative phosphoesterase